MLLDTGYPRAPCTQRGRTDSSRRVTRCRRLRPARLWRPGLETEAEAGTFSCGCLKPSTHQNPRYVRT